MPPEGAFAYILQWLARTIALCVGFAICCIDVVGGEPRQLTIDGTLKFSPAFFPGGEEIVFATHENANLVSLWKLKLVDGSRERLHPNVSAHQFDPAFSADGRNHVFAMSAGSPQLVLVIQELATKTEVTFRPRDARATARYPTIAPDDGRVVFSLSDVQGHQIASVDKEGNNFKLLTEAAGMNCWPSFSPDGKQIAFGSSRDGNFEIYIMNADGSQPRRLTHSPRRDIRPSWSPDGRRIAFTSARDGNCEVYVMHTDGENPLNVTRHADHDDFPVWHPNGRHLVTISQRDGATDLYQFDAPSEP
jgi:TolB protein